MLTKAFGGLTAFAKVSRPRLSSHRLCNLHLRPSAAAPLPHSAKQGRNRKLAAVRALSSMMDPQPQHSVQMQVDMHNFEEVLPSVKAALQDCTFFAIDCEMTGLTPAGQRAGYLDEIEDRYLQLLASSQQFVINQFGLSAFRYRQGLYEARTWNFYVFPRPFEGYERCYLSQASSIQFLAEQGFDFNRSIVDGVPFLPATVRDFKLAAVDRQPRQDRPDIALTAPEDAEMVQQLISTVTAWLAGADTHLELPAVNSYQRAIQYQQLDKPQFGADTHPSFTIERTNHEEGRQALVLRRASPEEIKAWAEQRRRERLAAINQAAGFTAVFEAMRDCGKPCVGHNLSFDLAYSLECFAQLLPPTWSEYKTLVQRWFGAGVFDTKHLARQLAELFEGRTSLGEVYQLLLRPEGQPKVREFLEGCTSSAGAAWSLPHVQHADGFNDYVSCSVEETAHEAGFDAFMTGASFACLTHLIAAQKGLQPLEPAPLHITLDSIGEVEAAPAVPAVLESVAEFSGRINVTRTDIPYANLFGTDPQPDRSHVFYLSGLPLGSRHHSIAALFRDAGLGPVRTSLMGGGSAALVDLSDKELAPGVLEAAQGWEGITVITYEEFSRQRGALIAVEQPRLAPGNRPLKRARPAPVEALPTAPTPAANTAPTPKSWCKVM